MSDIGSYMARRNEKKQDAAPWQNINTNDVLTLDPAEIDIPEQLRFLAFDRAILKVCDGIGENRPADPIQVVKGDRKRYTILRGVARLEAFRQINEELGKKNVKSLQVPALLCHANPGLESAMLWELRDSHGRNELSPMDIAHTVVALGRAFGYTNTKIARIFRRTQPWISQHRQLLSLEPVYQSKVHAGTLSMSVARALLKAPGPEARQKIYEHAATNPGGSPRRKTISARKVVSAVRKLDPDIQTSRSVAEWRSFLNEQSAKTWPPRMLHLLQTQLYWLDGTVDDSTLVDAYRNATRRPSRGEAIAER